MTNAELIQTIRNEIERQIKDPLKHCYGISSVNKLKELLSFLSTLEKSEKPMNQDELERAVVDYFEGYWPGMETAEQCNTDLHFTPPAIMRLARHFAEWGAEHAKKDEIPVPADLEEAANEYTYRGMPDEMKQYVKPVGDEVIKNFIAGAKWDRSQMMKEAVEKTVCLVPSLVGPKMFTTSIELSADELKGFKPGDKVRVIILQKED